MQLIKDDRINWARWEKVPPEATDIYPMNHWERELIKRNAEGIEITGDTLPWSKTHANVRLRPGETSIWAGINGHGKSILTSQVIAHVCIKEQKRACIASFEMHPIETLDRMQKQVIGVCDPSDKAVRMFMRCLSTSYIYSRTTSIHWQRVMAVLRYAREELGVDHFVIDSLMKCGIKKSDTDSQVEFIDSLCTYAKSSGVHIHIVHHARKGESEEAMINKFDIRGAGEVTDAVDNVFIIFRNKRKEREANKDEPKESTLLEPDTYLKCDKQRHWNWEGNIGLWYHKDIHQYVGDDTDQRIYMLSDLIDV